MAGRLKKIVDYVQEHTTFKNLAMTRMSLLLDEDVTQVDERTADDPDKVARYLEAAKTMLRTNRIELEL